MKPKRIKSMLRTSIQMCLAVIVMSILFWGENSSFAGEMQAQITSLPYSDQVSNEVADPITSYLPISMNNFPWPNPFGVENNNGWKPGTNVYKYGEELNSNWVRMGSYISWRKLQPNEGDPIKWDALEAFEEDLKEINNLGMTPIVIVKDNPYWAVIEDARKDSQLTSCAPIKSSKLNAFEDFMRTLVKRYKVSKFNVHHWEIGNEPDVDPDLVKPNNVFGCWGDIDDDKYYGGQEYGKMIKVIGKAIKEEDPSAKVWLGGLLLDSPNTTDSKLGKPENFLKGVLEVGAAPYFDILPYHWYPPYFNAEIDHDNIGKWIDWGGGVIGKARFLRQIMAEYGVEKPLVLNETALMCPPTVGGQPVDYCDPPSDDFYLVQANFVIRTFVRGLSEDVTGFIWYTLNGPGWRYTGLLTGSDEPKPVYTAYQHLIRQLFNTRYSGKPSYGSGIEAYAFKRGKEVVHILWGEGDETNIASIPKNKFIAAYDRLGNEISPPLVGNQYELEVAISPIYVVRNP
jgi:hypothetical protein